MTEDRAPMITKWSDVSAPNQELAGFWRKLTLVNFSIIMVIGAAAAVRFLNVPLGPTTVAEAVVILAVLIAVAWRLLSLSRPPLVRLQVADRALLLTFGNGKSMEFPRDGSTLAEVEILIRPPGAAAIDRRNRTYWLLDESGRARWPITSEALQGLTAAASAQGLSPTREPSPERGSRGSEMIRFRTSG
jgi:hypothetical protein